MSAITGIKVRLDDTEGGGTIREFVGRDAWALAELVSAGTNGLTTLERAAPRWSHYIYKLRRGGIAIETRHEPHAGNYPGHHARYFLRSQLEVIETRKAES
jgi:hypothetical protein